MPTIMDSCSSQLQLQRDSLSYRHPLAHTTSLLNIAPTPSSRHGLSDHLSIIQPRQQTMRWNGHRVATSSMTLPGVRTLARAPITGTGTLSWVRILAHTAALMCLLLRWLRSIAGPISEQLYRSTRKHR